MQLSESFTFFKESAEKPVKEGTNTTEIEKATDSKTQKGNELDEGKIIEPLKDI